MKNNKLYNVLFPVWLLLIFPAVWLIVFPGNFIIDSLVLIISMYLLKMHSKKIFYKRHILKVFIFGLLADVIGSAFLFLMCYVFELGTVGDELYLTIPGVLISALMIFIFNYFFTFRKIGKKNRILFSLIFAVVTAPYTFLIPTSWLYS